MAGARSGDVVGTDNCCEKDYLANEHRTGKTIAPAAGKYLPVYAPGKKPQFIEGNSFNMIIPLDEKLIEEFDRVGEIVTEGVTEGVKERLRELLQAIHGKEGLKTDDYAEILGISKKSLERYIKQLKDAGLIEFRGAPKSGGYYLIKTVKH